MNERERYITSSRRQVDHKVIEFSPFNRPEKLPDDGVQHGTTPDQGLVAGVQESYGNDFEPVNLQRLQAVVTGDFRLCACAEHKRHVGPVNVGIEQTNFVAEPGHGDGQVHGQRGLSYSAFPGTHGNDAANARQGLRGWRLLSGARRLVCAQGITFQITS